MPSHPTYPGVYLQEVPNGQRMITPAATSIAAFVGRAPIGPIDQPLKIFNFGDFTRFYGGLQSDYPLCYAVQDFFGNGGSEAVIVRLFEPGQNDGIARLEFPGAQPQLALRAANPGNWGNFLTAQVDTDGINDATAQAYAAYDLTTGDLFNLTVALHNAHGQVTAQERFLNLSVKLTGNAVNASNRIDHALANQSTLVRVDRLPAQPPSDKANDQGVGGNNGLHLSTQSYLGDPDAKTGLHMLDRSAAFNLLCIPPDRRILPGAPESEQDLDPLVRGAAARYCADRRAIFIADPPATWSDLAKQGQLSGIDPQQIGIAGTNAAGVEIARNAAVYFPRIWRPDILQNGQPALFAPSGAIAGVIAATDAAREVWKAPAGVDAGLGTEIGLEVNLTDTQNGRLNPLGINCLRSFAVYGPVVWGARTLRGADQFQDDYKYLPVRRLMLFIEQSIVQSIGWAVFEPNTEQLWSALRLSIGSFLADLQRQGAFYNYSVICDATTTSQADILSGVVNIMIAIAPVKPAEFIITQIQQVTASPAG